MKKEVIMRGMNAKRIFSAILVFALAITTAFMLPPAAVRADGDSDYVDVSDPVLFSTSKKITIYGAVPNTFNLRGVSFVKFTIYKGSTVVKEKKINYTEDQYNSGGWLKFKYTPGSYGDYKVEYKAWSDSDVYTANFSVKKPSAFKSYKTSFSLDPDTDTEGMYIRGLGNFTSVNIYRATSKKGTYKLIGTTTKSSFHDKKAPGGKDYYYKVKATLKDGKKTYTSKLSDAQCFKRSKPPVPEITSITYTRHDGITVKWKSNSKFDKAQDTIEIQFSTDKKFKDYDIGARVSGDQTQAVDDYPKYKGTYYYRIRVVRNLGSNYISDNVSKVKSVKVEYDWNDYSDESE